MLYEILRKPRILVFAVGGGGDIAGATALAFMLKEYGVREVYVSGIVWERYVVDPIPGPIPLKDIRNAEVIGINSAILDGDEYAIRGKYKVVFQAAKLARILRRKVFILDISKGARGIQEGINEIINFLKIDTVLGVDVGGDILAKGHEEELWSPLADAVSLAGLMKSKAKYRLLAIIGLGSDGELPVSYLLRRISTMIRKEAFLGALSLNSIALKTIEKLLKEGVISETAMVVYKAGKGVYEALKIREGSRSVKISPITLIAWFIDPLREINEFPLAHIVQNSRNILEARDLMRKHGFITELDIEEKIWRLVSKGKQITGRVLIKIRDELKSAMGKTC